ncbi:MAG: DsbC family protein [Woeseiaceae bacterium]|nr:DsbC family protein [Woeseiaceae bacterium]
MNRSIARYLFLLAVSGFMLAGAVTLAAADDAEIEKVRAKVTERFDFVDPESVHPSELDGWYMIQQGPIVAFVSADGRYLMQGDLIDLERNVNLTDTAMNSNRRQVLEELDAKEYIAFTPAEVRHTVTVFTDIDCTYCRRLHNQIDDYLDKGIEVRYLLYPRNGPASPSWSKAERVWCASDRNQALTAAKAEREFESASCDATMVQNHYVLGQEVGLSGTPAIVLEDGTLIGGYMPPEQLSTQLERDFGPEVTAD